MLESTRNLLKIYIAMYKFLIYKENLKEMKQNGLTLENWKIGNESQRYFWIMRVIDKLVFVACAFIFLNLTAIAISGWRYGHFGCARGYEVCHRLLRQREGTSGLRNRDLPLPRALNVRPRNIIQVIFFRSREREIFIFILWCFILYYVSTLLGLDILMAEIGV